MGVTEIAMTTGASQAAAEAIATEAGISTLFTRTTPAEKAQIIRDYKHSGRKVAVVGFDVTDSLALEEADVAITLSTGTEIARYRADIVLTSDDLTGLVEGLEISREGMKLAHQNLLTVSIPNWLGLALSLINRTELIGATLLNNGSVILGAANGLRPLLDDIDPDPNGAQPDNLTRSLPR